MADHLVIPRLVGPISTLSTVVRVQGHVSSAMVEVRGELGRLVARGIPSTAGDGLVPLSAGVTLREGEWLAARQSTTGLTSDVTPDGQRIQVLKRPSREDAGAVTILTHPYVCGQCLYVEGAYPGASVGLFDGSGFRGGTEAIGAMARFSVTPGLRGFDVLHVVQDVGGFPSQPIPLGPPDPLIVLPVPRIDGTIGACSGAILLADMVDGAVVELEHRGPNQLIPSVERRCVDVNSAFWPTTDLKPKDSLRARQTLCELSSDWSPLVTVVLPLLQLPWIHRPCANDPRVFIANLQIGAVVIFTVTTHTNGVTTTETFYGKSYSPVGNFPVPDGTLSVGAELQAIQTLCGESSKWSRPVHVVEGAPPEPPRLRGPLYVCATRVRVTNVRRGSNVRIISSKHKSATLEGCIGEVVALGPGTSVDVPVIALQRDDTLEAVVSRCGKTATSKTAEPVLPTPIDLQPPELEPVAVCGPIVVKRLTPGALVELYIDGKLVLPKVISPVAEYAFPSPASLRLGLGVHAMQRVCNQISGESNREFAKAGMLKVLGSERIQQLTGDIDRDRNWTGPAPNQTWTRYKLPGMDLGVPVEHLGRLYLFFGDSKQYNDLPNVSGILQFPFGPLLRPIAEVVEFPENVTDGLVLKEFPEDVTDGLVLNYLHEPNDQDSLLTLQLRNPGGPTNDGFFVPTGGFSYDGHVHVFVMQKATYPNMGANKTEIDDWAKRYYHAEYTTAPGLSGIIGGRSTLASSPSYDPGAIYNNVEVCDIQNFPDVNDLRREWKFSQVCPIVVDAGTVPGLPATGMVLLLWGTGAYRQSDLCFAWVQLGASGEEIPRASEWHFFTGLDLAGRPKFMQGMRNAIGLLKMSDEGGVEDPNTNYTRNGLPQEARLLYNIGEFSVTYLPLLRSWLLLYEDAKARISATPWGPWRPTGVGATVFNTSDETKLHPDVHGHGVSGLYGTYGLSRFYRWDEDAGALRIYFLGSFFVNNHGHVYLFQADIRCIPISI